MNYPKIDFLYNLFDGNIYQYVDLDVVKKFNSEYKASYKERISILNNQVFGNSSKPISPDNITALQYFLQNNFELENKTQEEINLEILEIPEQFRAQDTDKIYKRRPIEPTISILCDIGLYIAKCLEIKFAGKCKWGCETRVEYATYGHPYLQYENSGAPFSFIWIMAIVSLKLQKKSVDEDHLINLYSTWVSSWNGEEPWMTDKLRKLLK